MVKLILFFKKIHFVLIFILLETLAINYYANSTSYTKAKLVTASNRLTQEVNSKLSGIGDYMHLHRENERLTAELAELHNKYDRFDIMLQEEASAAAAYDSLITFVGGERHWEYYSARVTGNTITHQENYITIDKGEADGIGPDMAVVAGNSIAGYVIRSSRSFSVCMSVLNRDFRTSGKIKGTDYSGTILWDGTDYDYVTMSEVSKYADPQRGDTIVTSTYSHRFPAGLMVGTVENAELVNSTFYDIKVRLTGHIDALNNVLVIRNLDYGEINALEQSATNPPTY